MKITSQNYNETIENTKNLLIIDFWAEWCGPCKMLSPIIDELQDEINDVTFGKINVDEEMQIAVQNQISSIPTLLFIKNGEVVKRSVGYVGKDDLLQMINEVK